MSAPSPPKKENLLRFSTRDPDEFVERMSGLAPGIGCCPLRPGEMQTAILGAKVPNLGIFNSTLNNFRVQSESRPFYGITIFLEGQSEFLGAHGFETFHRNRAHLMHPEKRFDARMDSPVESLQLCFDQDYVDSLATRMEGSHDGKVSLKASLDTRRPEVQSFCRHASFFWREILRGGAILNSPLIARESVDLLGTLLVAAADSTAEKTSRSATRCHPASVRRAEDYLMANLSEPISIPDVAVVAGVSTRTLSREFRRQHGITIKAYLRQRRLEAANQAFLAAAPGEVNVTEVAFRFGFYQLGRFSADYREAFGERPSETLRR